MTLCDVLVLDGDENQAVACVRDLARSGARVAVGDVYALPKAALSRYAARRMRYRSPRSDVPGFLDDIVAALGTLVTTDAVLLPMTEATTLVLSLHRLSLTNAGYRLVLPAHEDLLVAFDKRRSGVLASQCGLRTPLQAIVDDQSMVDAACGLSHPVVIKAGSSNLMSANGLVAAPRPRYAMNARETREIVRELLIAGTSAIVQEFITGDGVGFFALYQHGRLQRSFAHHRLRDVHPTGSGSSYRESIAMSDELLLAGTAILNAMHWHGAAMVEFKQQPDGRLVFIEVNGRLWNSLQLAVAAGATFPRWLASLARDEPLATEPPYRVGVRARWLLGDLRHLVAVARGKPADFPGPFPTLSGTLRAMLGGLGSDTYDNLQATDPMPEIGDWMSAARKAWNHRRTTT